MRNRYLSISSIGVCIALASCTDVVGPPSNAPPVQMDAVRNAINILVESPTAPPLETYSLRFWLVQGAGGITRVNYRPGSNGVANRFLQLFVPKQTQVYLPSGSPLASGDSVLITASIDLRQLLVRFEPHGLVFGYSPARLRMYWGNANLDLNGDGLVDDLDENVVQTLLVIAYQPLDGAPWSVPSDQVKSLETRYIEISVPHFSNYAVSW
jgi:hypothetical protein